MGLIAFWVVHIQRGHTREFKIHVLEILCTAKSISTHRHFPFDTSGVKIQVVRDEGRLPPHLVVYAWKHTQFHCEENMVEGWTVCYFMITVILCGVNSLRNLQLPKVIQLLGLATE